MNRRRVKVVGGAGVDDVVVSCQYFEVSHGCLVFHICQDKEDPTNCTQLVFGPKRYMIAEELPSAP